MVAILSFKDAVEPLGIEFDSVSRRSERELSIALFQALRQASIGCSVVRIHAADHTLLSVLIHACAVLLGLIVEAHWRSLTGPSSFVHRRMQLCLVTCVVAKVAEVGIRLPKLLLEVFIASYVRLGG